MEISPKPAPARNAIARNDHEVEREAGTSLTASPAIERGFRRDHKTALVVNQRMLPTDRCWFAGQFVPGQGHDDRPLPGSRVT